MRKFIVLTLIGGLVGGLFAWGVIYIAPKLSDIFADAFFYPNIQTPVVIQDIKRFFAPASEQYIIKSVDQSIATSTKVVYADLGTMQIMMFENGEKIGEYPIQSVGREGTAWQTPLGQFDMSYKNPNHFSSIGHVWMPFSMHFFGNYFIHGWPYYEGGMPVAQGYSGGCIRLNTPDAEQIYNFVDKKTQLIVTMANKNPEVSSDFTYQIKDSSPTLESKFLVADIETGEVVASKDAQEKIAIGSFSKLMTGLISLETLNQYQETILDQNIVKISDVLYSLLLGDTDEAGKLLYEHKNKNQYLLDMNTRSKSLGMSQTIYTDVNGDKPDTVSTLEDTFRLLQYVRVYKPFLLKVLSLDSYTTGGVKQKPLYPIQNQEGFVAGFVDDKKTEMITLVSVDIFSPKTNSSEKKTFAIIVYGNSSSVIEQDTKELYEWVKVNIQVRNDR